MIDRLLADLVVLVHLGFIVFVGLGGLLLFRWPRLIWLHVPIVAWGVVISVGQWVCPLTPLENWLRHRAGQSGYQGSFIDHYIVPVIYPSGLAPEMGPWIAGAVAAINLSAWGWVWRARRRRQG